MKLVFSLDKYRKWRKEHDQLDDRTIDFIISNHHMNSQDGMERDELMRRGYIILEAWCDEHE